MSLLQGDIYYAKGKLEKLDWINTPESELIMQYINIATWLPTEIARLVCIYTRQQKLQQYKEKMNSYDYQLINNKDELPFYIF